MIPNSTKFVFFGTPKPAVEILEYLARANMLPSLIVTNPDKPKGRRLALAESPVKTWAKAHNIPTTEPINLKNPEIQSQLSNVNCQLFIVVAYGGIIPKNILEIPTHGTLNVHYSLLPKYRGATPVESQILNDDKDVGISIMLLDEQMDHGPIIAQEKLKIENSKFEIGGSPNWPPTATQLRKMCNDVAGPLLTEIIPKWINGEIKATPQDHTLATKTRKISAEDRLIDLYEDPYRNFLKIRALEAWGTYFLAKRNGKQIRVNIKDAEFNDGILSITRVVPEGKKEMSFDDFLKGNKV